jgi:hypothetical protein
MVFARPKLEQPVCRDAPVTADGRTIQTDARGLQVVHAQHVLIQSPRKGTPARIVAHGLQHGGQAVVADIQRVHRLPGALPQRVEALLGPGCHMVQPMVRPSDRLWVNHTTVTQPRLRPIQLPWVGKCLSSRGCTPMRSSWATSQGMSSTRSLTMARVSAMLHLSHDRDPTIIFEPPQNLSEPED